ITVPSCPSSRESVIVSVDPYPVVNIGSDTAFCGSSFVPFTLDATTPSASYAWSDASTNATLSITSSGTYWCDVTTTICTTRDSISVGANPIPTVTFPNPSFVCANADADSLTGGMPMGGVYSGTNVANGEFDPTAAGAGTDTLFYTYTDSIGCFATDTAYILVDTVAAPVMTSFTDICADNGNVLLNNATPVGGTYSGPGVTGVAFVPDSAGIGTHTIQYVYTGNNGCMDSTSEDITVNPLPMVSMTLQNNLCLNAMPIMLNTGMPMGGTYTIDGTVDTVYAPTVAGMDTVVYSYTDSNSCTSTDTSIIAADTVPVVTFATMADVCHMSATVTLMNGMPMGGTYTGNNVNTTAGTYSTANVGTDSVLYVFTDSNNCTESAIQTITVNALPTVALANFTDVCENAPSFALTGGTPAMGTYKGNGVNGANYDASTAGIGNDMITYVYTDVNNCTDSATNTIVVTAVTSASLRFLGEICDNGAAKDLVNTGIPSGGVFSGAGMTGSTFDPTVTGAGTQTISYTYTNAANCTDSTTNTILVEASPTFNIVSIDDLEGCNNSPIKLTTDLPGMTYRWSNGDVADTATYLQSGDASVKVTDPNTNSLCFNRDTITGLVFDEKCVGIDEALFGTSINYFPNPNNGTFNYSLEGFEGMDIDVTIVNAGGQVVYNNTWNNVSSMHNGTIQLESVETGLYFITLSTEKGNVMHRISITE
ncbi:MAG: T9SS type A sorting domain-containing protein, partial [Salibacteraceae bacterium]